MLKGEHGLEIKKKLLVYAHYYFPDVASTGQLLQELCEGMTSDFEITVICVVPSYTGDIAPKYRTRKTYYESLNGINIVRVSVPQFSKSHKLSRVRNIVSYFVRAFFVTFELGEFDYIFSISQPPILGGLLGVLGKWIKNAKLIYNIQDFNPEQIIAVGYSNNKLILKLMMIIDKFNCKQADKVIVVGRDMVDTYNGRFREKNSQKLSCINNWVNETEIVPLNSNHNGVIEFKQKFQLIDKYIMMYSGNIGLYYGLDDILSVINEVSCESPTKLTSKDGREVVFVFIGEGSIKERLVSYKETNNLRNVVFLPYQAKAELVYSLNAADVHLVVNSMGIKGISVPSKVYGVMAVGKPIIAFQEIGSEVHSIIIESNCGMVCVDKDLADFKRSIVWFIENSEESQAQLFGQNGREYLETHLSMRNALEKYVNEISSL